MQRKAEMTRLFEDRTGLSYIWYVNPDTPGLVKEIHFPCLFIEKDEDSDVLDWAEIDAPKAMSNLIEDKLEDLKDDLLGYAKEFLE